MKAILFSFLLLPFLAIAQSGSTPPAQPITFPIPVGGGSGAGLSQADKNTIDSFRLVRQRLALTDSLHGLYPVADAARLALLEQRAVYDPTTVYNRTGKVPSEDVTGGTIFTGTVNRSFTAPGVSNVHLMYTPVDILVSGVRDALIGTSPSVTYSIKYGSLRSTAVGTIVNARNTTSTVGAAATLTTSTVSIPAGSWIWLEITAVSGTITDFGLTLIYN